MNLHQLECFLAVARCMSFSRAAEELFVTQTAVTYQISVLEKELSAKLFDRSRQRIALTAAGQVFVEGARRIVGEARRAQGLVEEASRFSGGVLDIACYGDVLYPALPRLLRAFRAAEPDASVRVRQRKAHDVISGLHGGMVDVGVVTSYGGLLRAQSQIDSLLLFRDRHYAILPAGHELAGRVSVCIEELYPYNMIQYAEKDLLQREESTGGFRSIIIVDEPQSANVLVAAGYGVSVSVGHVRDASNSNLAFVPIEGEGMDVCACWRRGDDSHLVGTFVGLLREADFSLLLA